MDFNNSEDQQAQLNRLIRAIDYAYHHPGQLMWRNFLGGLFSGLGATIGVAIVVAVLGLMVREFGGLPLIGNWLNELGQFLPQKR